MAGGACGGGQDADYIPFPISTAVPTVTIEATPTATVSGCPLPAEGKGNIAGILVWNGKPWASEFGTVTNLKLYSTAILTQSEEDREFTSTATVTTNYDGSFCFHNIEPDEYWVVCWCPPGCNQSAAPSRPVTVADGKTYWLGFDPYIYCSYPDDE